MRRRRAEVLAAGAVVGAVSVGAWALLRSPGDVAYPPPFPRDEAARPIQHEADVFRTGEELLAVAPDFRGDSRAHVRTETMYRRLRAYQGAPPRIPHGLTETEYRDGRCNVCHQRGGWVARFGSYAPVTPHPEYASCLQCHLPSDELVGRSAPESSPSEVCGQCHVNPDARAPTFVPTEWRSSVWPQVDRQALEGSPHLIPHEVRSRGNCVACHAGPAAVVGLRTDHPERRNCLQCHVPLGEEEAVWPPPVGETSGEAP